MSEAPDLLFRCQCGRVCTLVELVIDPQYPACAIPPCWLEDGHERHCDEYVLSSALDVLRRQGYAGALLQKWCEAQGIVISKDMEIFRR